MNAEYSESILLCCGLKGQCPQVLVYIGIPIMQHGRLKLVTDELAMPIPMEQVVNIVSVD